MRGGFFKVFDDLVEAWERGDDAETQRLHEALGVYMAVGCPVCREDDPRQGRR